MCYLLRMKSSLNIKRVLWWGAAIISAALMIASNYILPNPWQTYSGGVFMFGAIFCVNRGLRAGITVIPPSS